MKALLIKELKLASHPTNWLFLALSAMLIIPNYPYYVVFFYTSLGLFFTCLSGRENHDIAYSMSLPVRKGDLVRARILYFVLLELAQFIVAIPFAALRQSFAMPGNQVGMDANIALFGLALAMMGLFNLVFLTYYYKKPDAVGGAFIRGSTVVFVYIVVAEACAHALPFFRDVLDTKDPQNLSAKLAVLAAGAVVYALLTALACKKSVRSFEALDL